MRGRRIPRGWMTSRDQFHNLRQQIVFDLASGRKILQFFFALFDRRALPPQISCSSRAPVAQLDKASDYGETLLQGTLSKSDGFATETTIGKVAEERHAENLQGFPHGLPTTEADTINADPLTFLKRSAVAVTLNDLGRGQCRI